MVPSSLCLLLSLLLAGLVAMVGVRALLPRKGVEVLKGVQGALFSLHRRYVVVHYVGVDQQAIAPACRAGRDIGLSTGCRYRPTLNYLQAIVLQ